jgi:hypothetical protein
MKLLETELNDLKNEKLVSEQARQSDEKNIRELFQDKYALKEKNQELEEKLLNVAAVQQSLEQDLTEGRARSSGWRNSSCCRVLWRRQLGGFFISPEQLHGGRGDWNTAVSFSLSLVRS